jgi:hypothetical protein
VIRGPDIAGLIELFETRQVDLYHACQLLDFQSYLRIGGIPSRAVLEGSGQPFTAFRTDKSDRERRLWDKVFVNLEDFGYPFAAGCSWTPNVYGPILCRLCPEALEDAVDIAVCLRSAGAVGFNRGAEALISVSEVDRVFRNPSGPEIKFKQALQEDFGPSATRTEASLSHPKGMLGFEYLREVIVDPYTIAEKKLVAVVGRMVEESGGRYRVVERRPRRPTSSYDAISDKLAAAGVVGIEVFTGEDFPDDIRSWAKAIQEHRLVYQYKGFAGYFTHGTIPIVQQFQPVEDHGYELQEDFQDEDRLWADEFERDTLQAMKDTREEIADDRDDLERSNDEGWYYEDDEE